MNYQTEAEPLDFRPPLRPETVQGNFPDNPSSKPKTAAKAVDGSAKKWQKRAGFRTCRREEKAEPVSQCLEPVTVGPVTRRGVTLPPPAQSLPLRAGFPLRLFHPTTLLRAMPLCGSLGCLTH